GGGEGVVEPTSLPLAHVLVYGVNGEARFAPQLRQFLLARLRQEAGASGLLAMRRETAALARAVGEPLLAVETLLEGELLAEATEVADREAEQLCQAGQEEQAREMARALPLAAAVAR